MEYKFAFICDFAEREQKLHALGIGWDTIFASSLPAVHPTIAFVASLRGSIAEKGTKDVQIRLIDADGEDVIPVLNQQVPFDVAPGALEGALNILISLSQLELKKYGAYAIHLVVQGVSMARVEFNVVQAPTTA